MPRIRNSPALHISELLKFKEQQLRRLDLAGSRDNALVARAQPRAETVARYVEAVENAKVGADGKFEVPTFMGKIVAVKDNFTTDALPTTCASNILQNFQAPSATAVQILEREGIEVVAKTNMDEFGMGSHSSKSAYGAVRNNDFSVGGSSGGSALAVARGVVDFALGTDTGGSVRLPAAYTQVVGFKPSYGRISRHGVVPYANSLDTVGLFFKSCSRLRSVFELLDQPDPKDPTCLSKTTRARIDQTLAERQATKAIEDDDLGVPRSADSQLGLRNCRIGVPLEYNIHEMHPYVRQAWMVALAQLTYWGHKIVPISLPTTKEALSAYYILAPAEASSNLAKYDGVRYGAMRGTEDFDDEAGTLYAHYRGSHLGEEVKHRILLGSYALSAGAMDNYFIQAQKVRRLVENDFNLVFRMGHPLRPDAKYNAEGVDFIVCPTAPTPPPRLSEVSRARPLDAYTNDVFTVPASLAGLPAISVPAQTTHGGWSHTDRAVGIQIIGQYGDDIEVIRFANGAFSLPLGMQQRSFESISAGRKPI